MFRLSSIRITTAAIALQALEFINPIGIVSVSMPKSYCDRVTAKTDVEVWGRKPIRESGVISEKLACSMNCPLSIKPNPQLLLPGRGTTRVHDPPQPAAGTPLVKFSNRTPATCAPAHGNLPNTSMPFHAGAFRLMDLGASEPVKFHPNCHRFGRATVSIST